MEVNSIFRASGNVSNSFTYNQLAPSLTAESAEGGRHTGQFAFVGLPSFLKMLPANPIAPKVLSNNGSLLIGTVEREETALTPCRDGFMGFVAEMNSANMVPRGHKSIASGL